MTNNAQSQLIERCKKGDSRAQYELYQNYVSAMYNVSYRLSGNRFDAEDNLQEAFVKAFQHMRSFKGESSFGSWLKRIVVNQCITQLRKQKRFMHTLNEKTEFTVVDEENLAMDEKIPMHEVKKAIAALPEGARVVFTLKAIEEYKFSEISAMLGLSESNCKVQYHRSKKLLAMQLKALVYSE
ncbi:MAG: RNA polymerase sigma factor [Salinivirgaceae bacterium]